MALTPEETSLQQQIATKQQQLTNANAAGYGTGGQFANQQIPNSVLNPPVGQQPTPTGQQPITATSPTGLDDSSFMNLLNGLNTGFQTNNALVNQKTVVMNALLGNKPTNEQIATLPKDIQGLVLNGNKDQLLLQAQVLNDSITGANSSVASSISFLTDGYQKAQSQYQSDLNNVLNYSKNLGVNPSDVIKALYPQIYASMPKEQIDALDALNVSGSLAGGITTIDSSNLDQIKQNIVSQESHGDYSAVNADSGALGAYQIMPANLSVVGLTDSAADQQKFLSSPQLQDQAYDTLMNQLTSQYGGNARQVVAAYYGGPSAAQMVDTPAGDAAQNGGPSINEYVNSVLGGTPAAATSPLVQNLIDQINSGSLTYDQALVQAKSYGKNVQQQLINGYKVQTPSGGGVAGFSYNDGSLLPKDDPNVYQTDPTINGTPAQVYMDGINYALKGATALSGLGLGQANQVKNYRQSVKAKGDALAMAAGTTTAQLQQDFTASGTALKSQVTFLNNTERALNGAEQSSNIVQRIFQENNLNTADSTYLNMKVNDFVKQFGSSGEIRAYQAGMTEVGNEYAQVFARGGQRNQTIDQRALDITDGNLKLSDMQDTLTSLQAVGGRVVKTSQDQINNIDAGGDLANFYSYIYGGYSGQGGGTTGQGSVSTMSNQDLLNSIPGL